MMKTFICLTHLPYEIVNLYTTWLDKNRLHGPKLSGEKVRTACKFFNSIVIS